MRFFLDNDTDVAVRTWLIQRGHEAWTANEAGLALADDDELSVYADDHGAVLITHDREFTERRKKNCIGRHIRLCCDQPDAVALLEQRWGPQLLGMLNGNENITLEVRAERLSAHFGWE